MENDFSQHFVLLYDKFCELTKSSGARDSNLAFARFLGHEHDGKVRAWKKGQWPSAEDCWILHRKLGCSLEWLVSGQGKPWPEQKAHPKVVSYDTRAKPVTGQHPDTPEAWLDEHLLFAIIEALEEVSEEAGKKLEPSRKAEIICKLYVLFSTDTAAAKRPTVVLRLIREAVDE